MFIIDGGDANTVYINAVEELMNGMVELKETKENEDERSRVLRKCLTKFVVYFQNGGKQIVSLNESKIL